MPAVEVILPLSPSGSPTEQPPRGSYKHYPSGDHLLSRVPQVWHGRKHSATRLGPFRRSYTQWMMRTIMFPPPRSWTVVVEVADL